MYRADEAISMYYVLSKEHIIECLQTRGVPAPRAWQCPCGEPECESVVYYGRDAGGRVAFMATITADPKKPLLHVIDNVEDFNLMMESPTVHEDDRMIFAIWLNIGLREVLLNS